MKISYHEFMNLNDLRSDIRILQISDTHLFADPQGQLCGQKTRVSFEAVLDDMRKNSWPPDLILVTGDLSQDNSDKSYIFFREKMLELKVPIYCLPGNHDSVGLMTQLLNRGLVQVPRSVMINRWQIILMNSVLPKKHVGHVSREEMEFLKEALQAHPEKNVLIALHHSPVLVKSQWLDSMVLDNSAEFFDLIDRFRHIKGVVYGHIHQEYETKRKGVSLIGSPSTCVQFKPKSNGFRFDNKPPGYRWLHLFPNGKIHATIERVKKFKPTVNLKAKGY